MKKLCIALIASLLLFSTAVFALPPTPGQHPSNSPTVVGRSMLSVQPIIYPGLDYDAQTGSFTVFNTITGATSGAAATIIGVVDTGTTGRLTLTGITGTFQHDEIIYESALGAELLTDGAFAVTSKAVAKGVAGITKANPGVVSFDAGHGYVNGDVIFFDNLNEMTELNGEYWKLRANSGNTFELTTVWDTTSLDTSAYGTAETTGGNCAQKVTFTNWAAGTGWHPETDYAGALSGKAHCDGTQTANAYLYESVLSVEKVYKIVFTLSNFNAGTVRSAAGTDSGVSRISNGTYYDVLMCVVNAGLYLRADADFIGAVDDVSGKQATNAALANGTVY